MASLGVIRDMQLVPPTYLAGGTNLSLYGTSIHIVVFYDNDSTRDTVSIRLAVLKAFTDASRTRHHPDRQDRWIEFSRR